MSIKKLVKCIGKGIMLVFYKLFRAFPVKSHVVFFESNLGRNYADSPKYIYLEMLEKNKDWTFVWSFAKKSVGMKFVGANERTKVVERKSIAYFFALARSGVWVSNCRMPEYLKKRSNQRYIQTWHGTPLKKLALDMNDVVMAGTQGKDRYKESFRKNAASWDCLVSQNPFSSFTFRRCFDFGGQMIESGYPRNDILFSKNNRKDIDALKRKLGIPTDRKCILYAPTFRDDEANGSDSYKFSNALDFEVMARDILKDEYVMLVKYHYLVRDKVDFGKFGGRVIEFNEKTDISELYLVSDMLITDYSSVMFDYSILKRPIFYYCYDYERYKEDLRGFYFDFLATAPGPIVRTTEELVEAICEYDPRKWEAKYQRFNENYNCFDDGHASEKVVDMITGGEVSKLKLMGYRLYGLLYSVFKIIPIGSRRVYFIMTHDDSAEGNCGVMKKYFEGTDGINYKCSALTRSDTEASGKGGLLKFVIKSSWQLSRAKYVFMDNGFLPLAFLHLRKKTKLVQLWHGTGTIKKFGQDSNKGVLAMLEKRGNRNIDIMTVNSDETKALYSGCFGIPEEKVFVTGLPRTDCFFEEAFAKNAREKLEQEYPQLKGRKLVLYVPTFRDDTLEQEKLPFDIELTLKQLPENYCIGMRLHPFLSEAVKKAVKAGKRPTLSEAAGADSFVIDFTQYKGINTLLGAADILITDYSSVVFEYCVLNRPMIFYAYDLEKFTDHGRGFYCDYEDYVPGTVVRDTKELLACLYTELYMDEKRKRFAERAYAYTDGKSAERIYNLVTSK